MPLTSRCLEQGNYMALPDDDDELLARRRHTSMQKTTRVRALVRIDSKQFFLYRDHEPDHELDHDLLENHSSCPKMRKNTTQTVIGNNNNSVTILN